MKKSKILKFISKIFKGLKNKNVTLYKVVIIALIMWWIGWITRGFKFIKWENMDYGDVAEWFSGLGTIIAILSSFYFFREENEPSLSISYSYFGNSKILLTATNNGRIPISVKFFGFQLPGDGTGYSKENFIAEEYEKLMPGESYKLIVYSVDEILKLFGNNIKGKSACFKATYFTNTHKMFSKDFTITNGGFGGPGK